MSVNSFDHEDEMTAAYDAAYRALCHAVDIGDLSIADDMISDGGHKVIKEVSRRIADAVIHSSARDITDMGLGVQVEYAEKKM